jgi:hypothetical protein
MFQVIMFPVRLLLREGGVTARGRGGGGFTDACEKAKIKESQELCVDEASHERIMRISYTGPRS